MDRVSLFLAIIGLIVGPLAGSAQAQDDLPAPLGEPRIGELVTVDGYTMRIHCVGAHPDRPTVIFDAGAGATGLVWYYLQQQLADEARSCSYDRAGNGWSEARPEARTIDQINTELDALLRAAGEDGPYLLVAHSLMGLSIPVFAADHLDAVVGVVLVDPTPVDPLPQPNPLQMLTLAPLMNMIGSPEIQEQAFDMQLAQIAERFADEPDLEAVLAAARAGAQYTVGMDEGAEFRAGSEETAARLEAALTALRGTSFVIITAGAQLEADIEPMLGLLDVTDEMAPSLTTLRGYFADTAETAAASHARAAERAAGEQVFAPNSGHSVMFYEPEIILGVIRDILADG
ncbi:MAG: alpha/beta hydrolase [Chloroflexi bacterium]|nr:alpha/beta hydrolase [Chloroflexota bacterium]